MSKVPQKEVFNAIQKERKYQDEKWGAEKPQSLAGFLLIARKELDEAEEGWMNGRHDGHSPLSELVQVAATCVAALEMYGVCGNVICNVDTSEETNATTGKEYIARRLTDDL